MSYLTIGGQEGETMIILVSGSTGLIGSALVPYLTASGHTVKRLVRKSASSESEVQWDPERGTINSAGLENVDAVVHLAGESIMGRWTDEKKAKILNSRKTGTGSLATALSQLTNPPKVFVCASATGFYGDRGDELLTEESASGTGFLPDVCKVWEDSAAPAVERGIRTVHLRFGIVLTQEGGALKQMLTPFKMGAGGRVGSGNQWWSWVAIDDVLAMIHHVVMSEHMNGPVNAVTPNPVTSAEFAKLLGKVLNRPAIAPLPGWVAKIVFGEMAEALLLASARVEPAKLITTNYPFLYPELEGALRHVLDSSR